MLILYIILNHIYIILRKYYTIILLCMIYNAYILSYIYILYIYTLYIHYIYYIHISSKVVTRRLPFQ